jgi:N-acetylglucosamine-6-phosphate deacetylase
MPLPFPASSQKTPAIRRRFLLCYVMESRAVANTVIDIHTHGIEGLDTRDGAAAVRRIAEVHGDAGVDEIILSIYPAPPAEMRAAMAAVSEAMEAQAGEAHAARIRGVHLEGPFLNPAYAGALDASAFCAPDEKVFDALIEGFAPIVRTVTIAPEMAGAAALIRKMERMGIRASMGHSGATYTEAEAGFRAGARGITHLFNAMAGLHHREPGIAGFGLMNREVYAEVIGDLRHVDARVLDMVFRLKGPGRVILVSDSVRETRKADGAPPEGPTGRLLGGSMTVTEAAAGLIEAGLDEETVMAAHTVNPHAFLAL